MNRLTGDLHEQWTFPRLSQAIAWTHLITVVLAAGPRPKSQPKSLERMELGEGGWGNGWRERKGRNKRRLKTYPSSIRIGQSEIIGERKRKRLMRSTALVTTQREYCECRVMSFTEPLLQGNTPWSHSGVWVTQTHPSSKNEEAATNYAFWLFCCTCKNFSWALNTHLPLKHTSFAAIFLFYGKGLCEKWYNCKSFSMLWMAKNHYWKESITTAQLFTVLRLIYSRPIWEKGMGNVSAAYRFISERSLVIGIGRLKEKSADSLSSTNIDSTSTLYVTKRTLGAIRGGGKRYWEYVILEG